MRLIKFCMDGLKMQFKSILTFNNLLDSYHEVALHSKNKMELYKFSLNLNINLYEILNRLLLNKYEFSSYHLFMIEEPKYRIIMSETIEDKIVNHLISKYLLKPILEPLLIDQNVATRINKGSNYAFNLVLKYINTLSLYNNKVFILKIDISKYFYNIDHHLLINLLTKYFDMDSLNFIKKVLDTTNQTYINFKIKELKIKMINKISSLKLNNQDRLKRIEEINKIPNYEYNRGLSIGNMSSQILAIFYLNNLDHFIKEKLKCHFYLRYMDDLIILDNNINDLNKKWLIINRIIKKYNLVTNSKSKIYSLNSGFNFLGYSFKKDSKLGIKVSYKTYQRISFHLKRLYINGNAKYLNSIISYDGFFLKTN